MNIQYRQEYPNPQFMREDWINLNGEWEFEFDFGNSGMERKLFEQGSLSKKINVPFCPESKLSGVECKDFMNAVWYLRKFNVPESWIDNGHIFIHFGAVDYFSRIFVNKTEVGTHSGGYTSFKFDITEYIKEDENTVMVYAFDDNRLGRQPKGKQAHIFNSSGCDYTRTTGIWQTVWLEHTPENYIEDIKLYPDIQNGKIDFKVRVCGKGSLTFNTYFDARPMGKCELKCSAGEHFGTVNLNEVHLWQVGEGNLYDAEICFGDDCVKSYFGMRNIAIDGMNVLINNKSVFQRLVLDQGFYTDGIYTAPSDDDLKKDIQLSLDAGFNGARLHEKVFEPRFLYHCDKMGYIVWGEYPNWGIDYSNPEMLAVFLKEWQEAVERDFNHPSIVGWCPFNETWDYNGKRQWDNLLAMVYHMTKSWDNTRPCIDSSGNFHTDTDIYDVHNYNQNPEKFSEEYKDISKGEYVEEWSERQKYTDKKYFGKPFFVSEYGGICWNFDKSDGWGYGEAPKTEEEFIKRYKGLTDVLLDDENMFGFCYTQLYDIEQEINGLYTYLRIPKFDMSLFKKINSRRAKIEEKWEREHNEKI